MVESLAAEQFAASIAPTSLIHSLACHVLSKIPWEIIPLKVDFEAMSYADKKATLDMLKERLDAAHPHQEKLGIWLERMPSCVPTAVIEQAEEAVTRFSLFSDLLAELQDHVKSIEKDPE